MEDYKITLSENEIPQQWYNVQPDLITPLPPPLTPDGNPIGPEDLAPIFPMELIKQEVSQERWIEIPDEILDLYKIWRPSPLHRARRLEKALGTPARIYYKNESVSPPGSHKPNTAVAQAYYNKQEGIMTLATETGAGQWGSALSFATKLLGMTCRVYMVKISYDQKPYRKILMQTWGAECFSSPTNRTNAGRAILEQDPDSLGSLGIAISEAVEDAATHDDVKYALGSVLNHVILHQSIVGLETKKQLALAGETPSVLIGCVGGGSNFSGFAFPFVKDKIDGNLDVEIIGAEPTACPTLTKGPYRYDHGDTAKMTPLMMMYTLGHDFVPPGIHAGGLRYHGDAPLLCSLVNDGVISAKAYHQLEVFEAAMQFARTEGHLPAPETAHAIKCVIDEAMKCKETGEEKCIVFNYSGHGFFDLSSYLAYHDGKLEEYEYPEEKIKQSISKLPDIVFKG
ncbi:MAG: TrpB-like pyridoxal phosphate-dependent enzyme [Elusimicrobiota bacterium]